MDERESILGAIYEDDDLKDVEMPDVEEGELVEHTSLQADVEQSSGGDVNVENQGSQSKSRRHRANKKKNKRKRSGPGPNVTNINRFVLDTCKRLKEKKSYMVYTAVGCLGISALSDLVKEVDAIQSCGGQMTTDGKRHRTGGGILWNIIKARSPVAYTEIMKKTREFEKQFKQQNNRQTAAVQIREDSPQESASAPISEIKASIPVGSENGAKIQQKQLTAEAKRKSVHDRIRVPVSYDDIVGEDPKDGSA